MIYIYNEPGLSLRDAVPLNSGLYKISTIELHVT